MKNMMVVAAVAAIAIFQTRGDTYTVNAGDTQTLDSVTNTTRFTKSGAGTLVVTGTNSLTTLTSSGGTLKGNVTVTDKLVFDAAQPPSAGLTVNGSLTLGSGVTVEIANTNLLTRGAAYTLATLPTPFPSTPASNLTKPWCVFLTNGGKTLKMHYEAGTMFLIK